MISPLFASSRRPGGRHRAVRPRTWPPCSGTGRPGARDRSPPAWPSPSGPASWPTCCPPGTALPPERLLAEALAVSRSTLVAALDRLRAEGLIISRQGSGTRVTGPPAETGVPRHVRDQNAEAPPEERTEAARAPAASEARHDGGHGCWGRRSGGSTSGSRRRRRLGAAAAGGDVGRPPGRGAVPRLRPGRAVRPAGRPGRAPLRRRASHDAGPDLRDPRRPARHRPRPGHALRRRATPSPSRTRPTPASST